MNKQNKQNFSALEQAAEKRFKAREKKKRPRMRLSGAGVKKLQKIIMTK